MPRQQRTLAFTLVILGLGSISQSAFGQFSWDADCGFNWADCCNYGTEQNPEYRNNWTIAPSSTGCPNLPGSDDDAHASTTVLLAQPYLTHVKSLSVTGTFMLRSELRITDDLSINGTITEPTNFLLQNGPAVTLAFQSPDATATISSFATLDFQFDGSIYGAPTALLTNNGQILKSVGGDNPPPYESISVLHIPVENNGTISASDGKLVFDHDTTHARNALIEVHEDAEIRFQGPTNVLLDGEVRGDGLIRFLSTYVGGATTVTGNYHPTNTLVAGGYATVNFEVDTSLENLTIGNTGIVGGSADLIIDDLLWNGGYSSMVGTGTTTVQDTMLIQHDSFAGGSYTIQRDVNLNGQSILDTNAVLYVNDSELRNDGDLELHGNTTIAVAAATTPVIQNFGNIRRNGGGAQSLINVAFLNFGDIDVESGELNFDGAMESSGPITLNAGTTLLLGHKLQTNHPSGSITGEGGVYFYNDFYSGDETVDSMLGTYDVGSTTIQAGTASFETNGIIAPQKTTGTLNLIQGFGATRLVGNADLVVIDQFNWSSGEMAGTGTTFVHGPMVLNNVGYPHYLSRTLELNVDSPVGPQPPASSLWINPQGTLRCKDVTVDGHVYNNGLISPGTPTSPVGELHITGGYQQPVGGQLTLNKLGPAHDQLLIDGVATLSGTLNASGFPGNGGQSFTILTAAGVNGAFTQINAPAGMQVIYTATSVILQAAPAPLCPADIAPAPSGNGLVNVEDLLAVIGAWGLCANPNNCPADINSDSVVNVSDLLAVIGSWGTCP